MTEIEISLKELKENLQASQAIFHQDPIAKAYLEGIRVGRQEKWHDLRKDPTDLPNNLRNVWTNVGASYYDSSDHCWRDEFGRTQGVIAWCEPKFEE